MVRRKPRSRTLANKYAVQGCAFILVCVFIGYFLAIVAETGTLNPEGVASRNGDTLAVTQPSSEPKPDEMTPTATALTRPNWLLGAWRPKGECELENLSYYFKFAN